jgi:hypothetical protein
VGGEARERGAALTLAFVTALLTLPVSAGEWSGDLSFEATAFPHDAVDPRQGDEQLSLAFEPEWYADWNDGRDRLQLTVFGRFDSLDDERTHADLRELYWRRTFESAELRLGVRKVYWGVTESQHLVDVINQTDLVENVDGEDKLGQPMANLALIKDWGTLDLFVLPYFRERTFAGADGRLRAMPRVEPELTSYESSDEERHVDLAVRWQRTFGAWDVGLAHFDGTAREPVFSPAIWPPPCLSCEVVLAPRYLQMRQTSLDAQATLDAWLWKLELVTRDWAPGRYTATTFGFERTLYGLFGSAADLGLIAEYLFDDRPDTELTTPFQDDAFLGARLAMNDEQSTELLAGLIQDLDGGGRFVSVEASRRLGQSFKLSLEARAILDAQPDELLYGLRNDDYVKLELGWYF